MQNAFCSFLNCPPVTCHVLDRSWWNILRPSGSNPEMVRRDFALGANGGKVESKLTSPTKGYSQMRRWERILYERTGYPKKYADVVPPTVVISNNLLAGKCWAFNGSKGHIGLSLSREIKATHLAFHHPPVEELSNEQMRQSPASITVWLFVEGDQIRHLSGRNTVGVEHFLNPSGEIPLWLHGGVFVEMLALQYHPAMGLEQTFALPAIVTSSLLVLEILANRGGEETCMYKVAVHGQSF
ncbi:SUN domain-containing protein 3 [Marasmius crinis-equi]|uniref:SUN domain-containing protein 3 n=1 Tax=Marasmius crinis-equi TaxID=585013 RepID=A0ABR3FJ69_9AGAR